MRTLARGNSEKRCKSRVDQLKKAGWKPISDIKLDPSPSIDISFVCVLERPERKGMKRSSWGMNGF